MKLKSVLILIGVMLLAGVVVYAANSPSDKEGLDSNGTSQEVTSNSESETTKDKYEQCKDTCTKVLSGQDQTTCLQTCEIAKDINSESLEDCNNLNESLRDSCIVKKAVELKDLDACETIVSNTLKATCYTGLAKELKDKKICERIPEGILKLSCLEKL